MILQILLEIVRDAQTALEYFWRVYFRNHKFFYRLINLTKEKLKNSEWKIAVQLARFAAGKWPEEFKLTDKPTENGDEDKEKSDEEKEDDEMEEGETPKKVEQEKEEQ